MGGGRVDHGPPVPRIGHRTTTVSDVELIEALRSTGAVREFEDTPVPDSTVYRLLDSARFAPNGGNRQAWRVVVVKDPALRRAIRQAYLPGWYQYLAQVSAGLTPWAVVTDRELERQSILGAPALAEAAARGTGWVRRTLRPGPGDAGPAGRPVQARHRRPRTAVTTPWWVGPRSTRSPGASFWPPGPRDWPG